MGELPQKPPLETASPKATDAVSARQLMNCMHAMSSEAARTAQIPVEQSEKNQSNPPSQSTQPHQEGE